MVNVFPNTSKRHWEEYGTDIMFEKDSTFAGMSEKEFERISNKVGLQYLKVLDPRLFEDEALQLNLSPSASKDESLWEFVLPCRFLSIIPDLPEGFKSWLKHDKKKDSRKVHFLLQERIENFD